MRALHACTCASVSWRAWRHASGRLQASCVQPWAGVARLLVHVLICWGAIVVVKSSWTPALFSLWSVARTAGRVERQVWRAPQSAYAIDSAQGALHGRSLHGGAWASTAYSWGLLLLRMGRQQPLERNLCLSMPPSPASFSTPQVQCILEPCSQTRCAGAENHSSAGQGRQAKAPRMTM